MTLAVRFGAKFARVEYTLLVALSYVLLLAGGSFQRSPLSSPWWLLPWLSVPVAISRIRGIWTLDGRDLNPLLGNTAKLQLLFGLLFVISIVATGSG